jgi:hypothetical protein|tara:strand:+ start:58 stop:288 length:231 start_codon:yes stop_codon:yes gene_type:complete
MLSGSAVLETTSDVVPPPGSSVSFQMRVAKEDFAAGTTVSAVVSDDLPPHFEWKNGTAICEVEIGDVVDFGSDADD